jgi:hypothetical protein
LSKKGPNDLINIDQTTTLLSLALSKLALIQAETFLDRRLIGYFLAFSWSRYSSLHALSSLNPSASEEEGWVTSEGEAEAASDWAGATAGSELEGSAGTGAAEDATSTGAGLVADAAATVVEAAEEAVGLTDELVELPEGAATDEADEMDDATDEDEAEG